MNIFKRLKNLWLLSDFNVAKNSKGGVDITVNNEGGEYHIKEKPKLAQIITRRDPIKEALKTDGI